MTTKQRVMTLRLDEELALQMDIIAAVTRVTTIDFVREAIRRHIQHDRESPAFLADAAAYIERQRHDLFGPAQP